MDTSDAQSDRNRPAERVDLLDPKTLDRVVCYLVARSEHRATELSYESAWDHFYEACAPLFRKLARLHCNRSWDVDDRVQDLWRVIVERLTCFDPEHGTFPSWLSTVARNTMTDQDRASHALGHLDDELERRLPSRETEPPTACEQAEVRTAIESAIEAVRSRTSETTYRIIHDHWVEGKAYKKIAADLGLPVKQVRDRHHRAVGILRAILVRRQ